MTRSGSWVPKGAPASSIPFGHKSTSANAVEHNAVATASAAHKTTALADIFLLLGDLVDFRAEDIWPPDLGYRTGQSPGTQTRNCLILGQIKNRLVSLRNSWAQW